MNNLIDIKSLSADEINDLIYLAADFKQGRFAHYSEKHCALMFFENSTRTKFSFECAINKLGAHPYIFDGSKSLTSKEELFDTINNLCALGIDTFIIRTGEENLFGELLKRKYFKNVHFINAGQGKTSHPTQALLDYLTMIETAGNMRGKKVVIIGDIKYSSVAKSNIELLSKAGAQVITCAPAYFREDIKGVCFEENLNKALIGADIVMCLRIQNERLSEAINRDDFIKNYQINIDNFPSKAVLMHPGPVNRDVEIQSKLLDSSIGKTILKQAQNGVYVKMAVLEKIFGGGG